MKNKDRNKKLIDLLSKIESEVLEYSKGIGEDVELLCDFFPAGVAIRRIAGKILPIHHNGLKTKLHDLYLLDNNINRALFQTQNGLVSVTLDRKGMPSVIHHIMKFISEFGDL